MLHCVVVFALASSLSNWLLRNGALLSTSVNVDTNGLRGLQWKDDDNSSTDIACQVPLCCAMVERDIDSLARQLLKEYELGEKSEYSAYMEALPSLTTLNLGCSWSNPQMERLRHEPTIRQFRFLRDGQYKFVNRMLEKGTTKNAKLAEWAYNIVLSRAVEGRFGRRGTVRAACLAATAGICSSVGLLLGPTVLMFGQSNVVSSDMAATVPVTIEAILPLFASCMALGYIVMSHSVTELAFVPWIDFANHDSSSAPCIFEYNMLENAIALKVPKQQHEWVTFSYGGSEGIGNDRLLGEYGFVEVDNPDDTLTLALRDDASVVVIGRNGKIQEPSLLSIHANVVESARELRSFLGDPVCIHPVKEGDPIDVEQATLAKLWRQEKVRLLDEFLLKHCDTLNDDVQDEKRLLEHKLQIRS